MEKPFFSIIIPCCEVAPYVRECLESVLQQSFGDWECLAVVEESRDRTEQSVRDVAAGDARFHVITEPRSGSPATPRNTGLAHASGKYVIFLDGDDRLMENALTRLSEGICGYPEADMYPCAFQECNEEDGRCLVLDDYLPDCPAELSGQEAFLYLDRHWLSPHPMAWRTVYRRDFLEHWNLRFEPGLVHEDEEFTPRALYRAARVVPLHVLFYAYRRREGSITTEQYDGAKDLRNYARVFRSLFAFHAAVSREDGYCRRVAACWAKSWCSKVFRYWFSSHFVRCIPRPQRLETLRMLFANGFEDFQALLRTSTWKRRVAGGMLRLAARHPSLGWLAELFFTRIYFPLSDRRNARRR